MLSFRVKREILFITAS